MEPLTPEDLLIREKPKDDESWFEGPKSSEDSIPTTSVRLERFQTLERIIREHPITVDPYLELAKIYLQRRRWNDAKRILDLAVEKFPEDEDANFLREEAQLNRSLQLLEEARKNHQAEPTRLTQEAIDRCQIELSVLREKICRSRLLRHPEQLELNLPLATALSNLGKDQEAIFCLKSIIGVPSLRARAAFNLGKLYEKSKQVPEALSAYRRAALFRIPQATEELRLDALTRAANLAEAYGMVDSALRYCKLLLEIQPGNAPLKQRIDRLEKTPL